MLHYVLPFMLTLLTGHADAARLAAYGDSTRVPPVVMWAVAWQESRDGKRGNNYVGPGIDTYDTLTNTHRRVCRERGRMQLNPCFWKSRVPRCSFQRIRANYEDNVYCAGLKLRTLYDTFDSWEEAIRRYNGRGPSSYVYQQRALAYIGRIALQDGTSVARGQYAAP